MPDYWNKIYFSNMKKPLLDLTGSLDTIIPSSHNNLLEFLYSVTREEAVFAALTLCQITVKADLT